MTNVLRTASHRSGPGGGACAAIGGRGVRSVELERGGGSILPVCGVNMESAVSLVKLSNAFILFLRLGCRLRSLVRTADFSVLACRYLNLDPSRQQT